MSTLLKFILLLLIFLRPHIIYISTRSVKMSSSQFETIIGGQNTQTDSKSKFKNNFDILRELGKGRTGIVYHVRDKESKEEYAVKKIKMGSTQSEKTIEREMKIKIYSHQNIVKYYDSWEESSTSDYVPSYFYI